MAAAIGIDVGRSSCRIAAFVEDEAIIIPFDEGILHSASCLCFSFNEIFYGTTAEKMLTENPSNTIYDFKRLIGHFFSDASIIHEGRDWSFKLLNAQNKPKVEVQYNGKVLALFPEEILGLFLSKMKETAETYLGIPVGNAVLTVPASFNDPQRRAMRDAGMIAGFGNPHILSEHCAVALSCGYGKDDTKTKKKVLVCDFGGGTCDVSVLAVRGRKTTVLSTRGDGYLGGEEFTKRIMKFIVDKLKKPGKDKKAPKGRDVSANKTSRAHLRNACETAKKALSSQDYAPIIIHDFHDGISLNEIIYRDFFENLCRDLFDTIIELIGQTIRDARMIPADIEDVILLGGSTRMPLFQKMLKSYFGANLKLALSCNLTVARGAAIKAAILLEHPAEGLIKLKARDVVAHSFGIGHGELMCHTIDKNRSYPTTVVQHLDYEVITGIQQRKYKVFQGEKAKFDVNKALLTFTRNSKVAPDLDILLAIDNNGLLSVRTAGNINNITIVSDDKRMTEDEMNRAIADVELCHQGNLQHQRARSDLKKLCRNVKSRFEREALVEEEGSAPAEQRGKKKKENALKTCDAAMEWLKMDKPTNKEEVESKKKEIEDLLKDIPDSNPKAKKRAKK